MNRSLARRTLAALVGLGRRTAVVAVLLAPAAAGAAPDTPTVITEFNVKVSMRDGVALSADVYRPAAPGKHPVILVRTPYTKGSGKYLRDGRWWADHGYALVIQDVRGRGDSDGTFYPLVTEAQDGDDTLTWAGTQPWSSGKVGMMGGSYLGWTQVYAAGLNNPHLAAMVPTVTPPDPNRNFPVQFGVVLPSAAAWLAGIDGRTPQDVSGLDLEAIYAHQPLIDMDKELGRNLPAWRDWVKHPEDDAYWKAQAYQDKLLEAQAPAMHVSGWYDDVMVGTTENFINMTTRARSAAARRRQWLVIGPWAHATNAGRKVGDIDFGPTAVIDFDGLQLKWFDHWLKGIDNGVETAPPVKIFVMGANTWVEENEWPSARTQYVKYYLQSAGRANSRLGDGRLSREPPGAQAPDRYRFDPTSPTPYVTELSGRQVGGPDDYRAVERRDDVLVYTTEPFDKPVKICGPLKATLFAASTARDTDFTAKVLDVHPDGYAQRLNDGIVRARYRHSNDRAELLTPGKVETYEIDAWSTCMAFLPGHRLRLEVASAAAGKFDVNMNTGGPVGQVAQGVVADQTIFHDTKRASFLLVPIVPDRP